MTFELILWWEK